MPGACVHVLMKKPVSKLSLVETKLGVWLNDDVQGLGKNIM